MSNLPINGQEKLRPGFLRRTWFWTASGVTVVLLVLLALELVARWGFGLGDPPLSQNHPTIGYLYQPHQHSRRFGNDFRINAYSMRSDPFPFDKSNPDELRVLFFGDSILNGGSLTDQADLATELLKTSLSQELNRPVVTGNVSAGSWGPQNQLAYIDQFGLFNADVVVLLLNSEDFDDEGGTQLVAGFSPDHPRDKPPFALYEAVFRYLPRYLPALAPSRPPAPSQATDLNRGVRYQDPMVALEAFCKQVTKTTRLILVFHPSRNAMLTGSRDPGFNRMQDFAREYQLRLIDLYDHYPTIAPAPSDIYRDGIHLNARGQEALAQALQQPLLDVVRSVVATQPHSR